MKKVVNEIVRPIALAFAVPVVGFLFVFLFEKFAGIEVSRLNAAIINLVIVAVFAFLILPRRLGYPFTLLRTPRKLGLYFPTKALQHILLGVLLAACTLGGILVASLLGGGFKPDLKTITLPQAVFSLNPALWEELFYRGVLMFFFLKLTGSLKKAAVFQIIVFGLAHIKGFGFWDLVDTFSVAVIAIAFTYVAYKTRTLLAGIVFHYFHDALIFFVQPASEVAQTSIDHLRFYALLWGMVAVACLLVKLAADRFGVQAPAPLYPEDALPGEVQAEAMPVG